MACRNCHPDRSSSGFLCEFIGFNVAPPHVEVHMDREALDRLTLSVIQAGIEVHRNLGRLHGIMGLDVHQYLSPSSDSYSGDTLDVGECPR
jgi:hypothetical protein